LPAAECLTAWLAELADKVMAQSRANIWHTEPKKKKKIPLHYAYALFAQAKFKQRKLPSVKNKLKYADQAAYL